MKVTIGQINSTNGDLPGNVRKVVAAIEKARADGSDLIVFPEVITHGYTSQDWFQDPDIIAHALDPLEEIIPATSGITAIVGTIRPNEDNDGRRLYNCAAVIHNGELVGFADKTLLPEYDVYDDPRYFEPSDMRRLFEINGVKLGVVVCEDFWNDKTFWKDRLYESDPADEVIGMGADVVVAINASPYNKGKIKLRCDMVAHRARAQGVPIIFVNLIGGNDGIVFDGASLVSDQEGDIILQATAFEEFVETVELDVGKPDSRGITGAECEAHQAGVRQRHTRLEANRHAHPIVLVPVPPQLERHRIGHRLPSDRQPADLARGREVPIEECRRDGQDVRDVVESRFGIVAGQQHACVDFERQEVADRVAVFAPVQAVRDRPARVMRSCMVSGSWQSMHATGCDTSLRASAYGRWFSASKPLMRSPFPARLYAL